MKYSQAIITDNLAKVLDRIELAAKRVGRSKDSVKLVAATKTQGLEEISAYQKACLELGIECICGENYAQELAVKAVQFTNISWHFIGGLQRNKIELVLQHSCFIQSVGSERVLIALNKAAQKIDRHVPVLLQVNISNDPNKEGFLPADILPELIAARFNTCVAGYMTVLQYGLELAQVRACYSELARMQKVAGLQELSIGMSDDFDVAVEEGATIVRVGSAIFGAREYS